MQPRFQRRLAAPLFVLVVTLTTPALAGDGQIEINQASVVAAGGFPLVLGQPGSYRLTSNLVVAGFSGGIQASVPGVRIDLAGFSVIGPGSCSATMTGNLLTSVDCTGNAGNGISGAESVRNGTVRGFTTGIRNEIAEPLLLVEVAAVENSSMGVHAYASTVVRDSRFELNRSSGFSSLSAEGQATIRNSIFRRNGTYGAYVASGTVDGCAFEQNGSEGLRSNVGRGLVVTNSFFGRNPIGIFGGNIAVRSNTFDENTSNFVATQVGENLCDGLLCP